MTITSAAFVIVVAVIFQVTAWTIDLPEVRKYYFERYDSHGNHGDYKNNEYEGRSFDNINGDSPHNTDTEKYNNYFYNLYRNHDANKKIGEHGIDTDVYAKSFRNYETYMVRKVQTALHNGTAYLDGLRRSIERYIQLLENCSRLNLTKDVSPEMQKSLDELGARAVAAMCREATKASEHVRRLAELALHTTRRLQDVAYTSKYNKEDSMEENELLLRLAWYLDKLAHLTGYDPDPAAHVAPAPEPTAPAPTRPSLFPEVTAEMKAAILNCLKAKSSAPATERCAFPVPQPVLRQMARMYNISDSVFRFDVPESGRSTRQSRDDRTSLDLELLEATDNKRAFPPSANVNVKTVRKRSISDSADPLVKVLKYYAKHKVWVNSNPVSENPELALKLEAYDVKNSLRSFNKRSVDSSTKINKIPEDPMQDLSKYIKSKPGVHYITNREDEDRLKSALETIHSKKLLTINKIKKLNKILRPKRAVPIEHVRETIKTNTDIHYDIPKAFSDKLKAVIHDIPVAISHLPLDHGHHGHLEHLEHLGHLDHHGHHHHGPHHHGHEHVIKDIKTDFHYDNIHKENPAEKIKAAIHHLHVKKVKIQKKIENLRKIFVSKRSVDNLRTKRSSDGFIDNLRTKHVFEPSIGKIQESAWISNCLHPFCLKKRAKRSSGSSIANLGTKRTSQSFTHNLRTKRSIEYEGVVNPRIPKDPQGDISYYVKNKKGTNYNFDVEQAALLRLSLEAVFQRGNINVVHKYGSNFNPAIPNPFYFGIARNLADV